MDGYIDSGWESVFEPMLLPPTSIYSCHFPPHPTAPHYCRTQFLSSHIKMQKRLFPVQADFHGYLFDPQFGNVPKCPNIPGTKCVLIGIEDEEAIQSQSKQITGCPRSTYLFLCASRKQVSLHELVFGKSSAQCPVHYQPSRRLACCLQSCLQEAFTVASTGGAVHG